MPSLSRRRFLQLAALAGLATNSSRAADDAARSLFDGKTLKGWTVTEYAGHGEVTVADGRIVFDSGNELTGITVAGEPPARMNYEISLEAMKLEGDDFFCGLTAPVNQDSCTLVLGGWGGFVVGISSIDDLDARENATMQRRNFESNRWYRIRFRVTPKKLQAWIDNEQVIDADIEGKKVGMRRGEIEMSAPLGICSFRTKSALRNITIKAL